MCAYLSESTDTVQAVNNEVNLSFNENTVPIKIEPVFHDAADSSEETVPDSFVDNEIIKKLVDDAKLRTEKWEFVLEVKQEPVDQQLLDNWELNAVHSIKKEPEENSESIRQSVSVCKVKTTKIKKETVEHSLEDSKLGRKKNDYDEQTELEEMGPEHEQSKFYTGFTSERQTERDREEVYPGHMIEITISPELIQQPGAGTDSLSSNTGVKSLVSDRNQRRTALESGRGGAARRYQCTLCGTKCSIRSDLTIHMRIHTGEKPYSCDICSKSFRRKQHLKVHILSHIGDKPYRCDICNKNFTHSGSLTQHMRIHNNYKPFSCTVCYKKFTRSGHLTQHMTIHNDYKPYSCNHCDKKFTRSGHLTQHMRTHNNDKPYQCEICDKKFNQSGHLSRHMRVHTGDKPYRCDICDKRFTQKGHLTHHTKLAHN